MFQNISYGSRIQQVSIMEFHQLRWIGMVPLCICICFLVCTHRINQSSCKTQEWQNLWSTFRKCTCS